MSDIKATPPLKVFILNGPPRCGKDSLAFEVARLAPFELMKFAEPLKDIAKRLLGLVHWENIEYMEKSTRGYSPFQDQYSLRDFYIHLSEQLIKPMLGNEYFGEELLRNILYKHKKHNATHFLITDGGFMEEIRPLLASHLIHKVHVIKIIRESTTYETDSRKYLSQILLRKMGAKCTTYTNMGSIESSGQTLYMEHIHPYI